MNRRTLLARFAAIAAAVAVAPAVKAAPVEAEAIEQAKQESYALEIRNRGAGKYLRVMRENGAVEAEYPLLTFEAMAADCAARGCKLERHYSQGDTRVMYAHPGFGDPAYQADAFDSAHLARVDAWRRGLHEQAKAESRALSDLIGHLEDSSLVVTGTTRLTGDLT